MHVFGSGFPTWACTSMKANDFEWSKDEEGLGSQWPKIGAHARAARSIDTS